MACVEAQAFRLFPKPGVLRPPLSPCPGAGLVLAPPGWHGQEATAATVRFWVFLFCFNTTQEH